VEEIAKKYEISKSRVVELHGKYRAGDAFLDGLIKLGNERPELRPSIAEKLHDLEAMWGKSKSKTRN
jgi:hypothetical protein